jgi:pimeloyl-ACP methyl ester carboxylesterase
MQVMVNGLLTKYELTGSGPLLLILHGWGDDGRGWVQLQNALSKTHKVLIPDLPGFGGTDAPKQAWGLTDYATFIQALLLKINLGDPDTILAHSNGGAMAIRGLAIKKFAANKLILLGSAGIRTEYSGKKKVFRLLAKTGKVLTTPLPSSYKQKLRRKMYASIGSDMFVAEHLQETFKRIVTDDVQNDAPNVAVKTLLIYGEQDAATPVRYGKKLEQLLPQATLNVVPSAEHFVHKDQFDQVIAQIEEFLS